MPLVELEMLKESIKLVDLAYLTKEGFVVVDGILAIAGTRNLFDWGTNIDMMPNYYGIHSGFFKRAVALNRKLINKDFNLVVGHSLGGAVAQLIALQTGKKCITFSCPKVFTKPPVLLDHTRFTIKGDVVPFLPVGFNYNHYGKSKALPDITPYRFDILRDHDYRSYLEPSTIKRLVGATSRT